MRRSKGVTEAFCFLLPAAAALGRFSLSMLSSQRERLYGNYFHSYDCATRTHNAELSPQFAFLNDNGDVEQSREAKRCVLGHQTPHTCTASAFVASRLISFAASDNIRVNAFAFLPPCCIIPWLGVGTK